MTDFSGSLDVCFDSCARVGQLIPFVSGDSTRGCERGAFHPFGSFCSFSLFHQKLSLVLKKNEQVLKGSV